MNRKNRFNMLEIEHGDGNTDQAKVLKKEISEKIKKQEINNKNKRDFKVIIDQKDFDQNLKKHQLKNQKEEIKKQKIELKETIKTLKGQAYIQIAIGLAMTILGTINLFKDRTTTTIGEMKKIGDSTPYYEKTITTKKVFLNRENYIHLLSLLVGLYLIYNKTKNKKEGLIYEYGMQNHNDTCAHKCRKSARQWCRTWNRNINPRYKRA